jgi:hypothetical protein
MDVGLLSRIERQSQLATEKGQLLLFQLSGHHPSSVLTGTGSDAGSGLPCTVGRDIYEGEQVLDSTLSCSLSLAPAKEQT